MAADGWATNPVIAGPGRWVGLVLLAAIGVIVVAVPPADGRRVPGRPQAVELPVPPRPGQCLMAPLFDPGSAPDPPPAFPRFDRCDSGTALGEVVVVHTRSSAETGPPPTGACRDAVAAYAGLRRTPAGYVPTHGDAPTDEVSWIYPFESDQQWVPQAPDLPAATSTWFACVAGPPTTRQQGSLESAFAGGRLPPGYGRCWVATNPAPGNAVVACAWPHTAELVGIATDVSAIDPSVVQGSCQRLAARLLDRSDPTVDGRLSVRIGQGDPLGGGAPNTAFCYLAGTDGRLLEGSMIGLGPAAITYLG
ncbi:MAG TPA: hypothetical protein VIC62_16195 [Nakamurella sp.]|jgi:hypothetical protein